jgi:hypothetical protein
MVDRQDIDALLVGALYGELTPADESRLAAHLESHPADRLALENMTRARDAVRESRVLAEHHEPPQAISALLLQEAARRAPKRVEHAKQSWFERLAHAFFARPALAAAAMLVVVVGVAGTMYLTKGESMVDTGADRRAESATTETALAPANTRSDQAGTAPVTTPAPALDRVADDQKKNDETVSKNAAATPAEPQVERKQYKDDYRVSLADHDDVSGGRGQGGQKAGTVAPARPAAHTTATTPAADDVPRRRVAEVRTQSPKPQPQELEKAKAKVELAKEESVSGEATGNTQTPGRTSPPATVPAAPPAQPSPPPPPTPRVQNAPVNQAPADKKAPSDPIAQAKALHADLVQLVANGKCSEVGAVGNRIASIAPDYYNANVATDRRLKACAQYLNDARNNANEQQHKSRAQKRVEPAPADLKQ